MLYFWLKNAVYQIVFFGSCAQALSHSSVARKLW